MKANEGSIDRVVRMVLGVALLVVALVALGGVAAIVVGVVAFILVLTGAVVYCPLYAVAHIRTNGRDGSARPAAS